MILSTGCCAPHLLGFCLLCKTSWTTTALYVRWQFLGQMCCWYCQLSPLLYDLFWSIHGIFQARVLEWVAIPFSRRSSWPRDWTRVSHTIGRRFIIWATREVKDRPKDKDVNTCSMPRVTRAIKAYPGQPLMRLTWYFPSLQNQAKKGGHCQTHIILICLYYCTSNAQHSNKIYNTPRSKEK